MPGRVRVCEWAFEAGGVFEGKQLLAITLPGSLDISEYEVDLQKGTRWWSLTAETINSHGALRIVE